VKRERKARAGHVANREARAGHVANRKKIKHSNKVLVNRKTADQLEKLDTDGRKL
jgi:hypothetical protein